MLQQTPAWRFAPHSKLTPRHGHVQLLGGRILGPWFCLRRAGGDVLWQRDFSRPNSIRAVAGGTIIASETRSHGPRTASFGCYGLSLETGELLWTSHAGGWWGRLVRMFDFVPRFANEFRDAPARLVGDRCVCASGRVLDVHTGKEIRRPSTDRPDRPSEVPSDARRLYEGMRRNEFTRVPLRDGLWLSNKRSGDDVRIAEFCLYLVDDDGGVHWTFDLETAGYRIDGDFFSYRYVPPYVYLVASQQSNRKSHPTRPHAVLPNPTVYHLLVLELETGTIAQDIRIDRRNLSQCRIEDADEEGVLISSAARELQYYKAA